VRCQSTDRLRRACTWPRGEGADREVEGGGDGEVPALGALLEWRDGGEDLDDLRHGGPRLGVPLQALPRQVRHDLHLLRRELALQRRVRQLRHHQPAVPQPRRRPDDEALVGPRRRRLVDGRPPGDELQHDDAEAEHVRLERRLAHDGVLRREVPERAQHPRRGARAARHAVVHQALGHAKVSDLHPHTRIKASA